MKKLVNLLAITLTLSLLLTLASCFGGGTTTTTTPSTTPPDDMHVHSFGEWETLKEATCTTDGERVRYCSCGEKQTVEITATGKHEWSDWKTIKEPANGENGLQEKVCNYGCGAVEQDVIEYVENAHLIVYRNLMPDNGTVVSSYLSEDGLIDLLVPEVPEGYQFLGWFTEDGKQVKHIPKGSTDDYYLYAEWELIEYTITYLDVKTTTNPTKYNVETELLLQNPEWSGLVFSHWTDQNGNSYYPQNGFVILPDDLTGNLQLIANWKANRNIATPSNRTDDILYIEAPEEGRLYFLYELGTIEHVVLEGEMTSENDFWYKNGNYDEELSETNSFELSQERATEMSTTVSKSVSQSASWEAALEWTIGVSSTISSETSVSAQAEAGWGPAKASAGVEEKFGVELSAEMGMSSATTIGLSGESTTDKSKTFSSSLSYKESLSTTTSSSISISADMPDGYYAFVNCTNVRVFALVTYDIYEDNYYLDTFSYLDSMHPMLMYYKDVNQLNNPTVESLDFVIPEEQILNYVNNYEYTTLEYTLNANGESYSVTGIDELVSSDIYVLKKFNGKPVIQVRFSKAFCGSDSNITVVIPDSVTDIEINFNNCYSLPSVKVDKNNKYYQSIDGNLYSKDGSKLIQYATAKKDTSFTIPDFVTTIDTYAFWETSLEKIIIPDSVTNINENPFVNCTSLKYNVYDNGLYLGNENNPYHVLVDAKDFYITNIQIHTKTKVISGSAFYACDSLTSIEIPNSVVAIGDSAFGGCDSLTNIEICDSVERIGYNAFKGCDSLQYNEYDNAYYLGNENNPYYILIKVKDTEITNLDIHNATKIIEKYAFDNCDSLISITIGDSVAHIDGDVFRDCTSLTSIEVDENNKYYKSIDGNLYSKDGKSLIKYAVGKEDALFIIPNTVTSIGRYAFYHCASLESVIIPDSVTSIQNQAFSWNTTLKKITIPETVTNIESSAFYCCYNLTIYCEVSIKPDGWYSGWYSDWNPDNRPVVWGYTGE